MLQVSFEKKSFLLLALFSVLCLLCSFYVDVWLIAYVPLLMMIVYFFSMNLSWLCFLLIMSVPLSFRYHAAGNMGIDVPDEFLMLILTLFSFVHYIRHSALYSPKLLWRNPLFLIIIASVVWSLVTALCSENVPLSLKYFFKRIWFIVPFLSLGIILFQEVKNIFKAYLLLVIPLIFVTIIVVYRFSKVGFLFDAVHDPLQPFFINHVLYGAMLSCVVPLVFGSWMYSKRFSGRWFVWLLIFMFLCIAVYFSYSRAAWAAVLFGICSWFVIRLRLMHWAMLGIYTLLLSGILWLSNNNKYLDYRPAFEKTIMHESLKDHIMATIQGTDISSAERYYRWIAAVRMSNERPWLGVGPNNFVDYYKPYTINSFKTWVSRNHERSTTHNYFLFMLVEQGYPGMLLYAFSMFFIFYYGQRLFKKTKDNSEKIIILSVLSMFAAFFINNLFSELIETDKIGSLYIMGFAVLIALGIKQQKKSLCTD
jgi:Lipid A core - O-antigen ligase and related enzymes